MMINTTEPSPNRTTLQDIADHCELSRSTVARVLNGNAGKFRIATATIEKVQLAAQQLNYRPNRLARAVNDRRTHLVGISVPMYASDEITQEKKNANNHRITGIIFSAISQHPMFKNYDLVLHNRDEHTDLPLDENEFQRDLLDGMIYSTPSLKHQEFFKIITRDIPLVLMGNLDELHDSVICVDINNRKMARQAAEHLLSIGRKNFMIMVPEASLSAICIQDRITGVRDALHVSGIQENPDLTRIIRANEKVVADFILNSASIDQVDAILCLTDELAMLCMDPLEQRGFRLPEDIALMGFNGTDLFSEKAARLSTVKIPFHQMAYRATEKLLEVLEGKQPYTPGFYEIPAELVIRESTVS